MENEIEIKVGSTYEKGKQKRIVTGFASYMVLFHTGTGQRKGEAIWLFRKWLKGAREVLEEV